MSPELYLPQRIHSCRWPATACEGRGYSARIGNASDPARLDQGLRRTLARQVRLPVRSSSGRSGAELWWWVDSVFVFPPAGEGAQL